MGEIRKQFELLFNFLFIVYIKNKLSLMNVFTYDFYLRKR